MKKVISGIVYSICSVFWLFFSILFLSALWLEKPGTNDWKEDSLFIPIGIVMLIIWGVSFIFFILSFKKKTPTDTIVNASGVVTIDCLLRKKLQLIQFQVCMNKTIVFIF